MTAAGYMWVGSLFLQYVLYISFVSVGQTFLSFQWDIFLLEVGILSCLLAPWRPSAEYVAKFFCSLVCLRFRGEVSGGLHFVC